MSTPINSPDLVPTTDAAALRAAYSCFPSGVVAVCADPGEGRLGMAASSFTTVSLTPPLVSLCVQNTSTTWPRLRNAPRLGVSVFAKDQGRLVRQLAGPAEHRFDDIEPLTTADGAVFIPDSAVQLSCSIYNEIPAGDHILVLLRIESLHADVGVDPLVFHASTFRALETRAIR